MKEYNSIKQFISNSRIGPQIDAIVEDNNLSQSTKNQPITQPTVGTGLAKRTMNSLRSLFSKNPQSFNKLPNNNPKKTLYNRAKSGLSAIRETVSETSEKAGSFIKDQLNKVTPQTPTSNSKAMRRYEVIPNNNKSQ